MQGGLARFESGTQVCTGSSQQPHTLCDALVGCTMQRCLTPYRSRLQVGTSSDQNRHSLRVSPPSCMVQRCLTVLCPRVQVGANSDHHPKKLRRIIADRLVASRMVKEGTLPPGRDIQVGTSSDQDLHQLKTHRI